MCGLSIQLKDPNQDKEKGWDLRNELQFAVDYKLPKKSYPKGIYFSLIIFQ